MPKRLVTRIVIDVNKGGRKTNAKRQPAGMHTQMVKFKSEQAHADIAFTPRRVIIAGYTGRDQAAVRAHINELAAQGVPPPPEVPAILHVTLDRLTSDSEVQVLGPDTSGEAEVVLLVNGPEIWVAVGSDHTDRALERISIGASKQVCPKPVSAEVWSYAHVREQWDSLILRSWVGETGREKLYQEGRLSQVLSPTDLLVHLRSRLGQLVDCAVIYTGTIPLAAGRFVTKPYFEAELLDEATGRSLHCVYRAQRADPTLR